MEAAVPPYRNDPVLAASTVGELYLYIKQLVERVSELANKANELDDARIAAEQRAEGLQQQSDSAHAHNDELRIRVNELETELRRVLDEDPAMNEIRTLGL